MKANLHWFRVYFHGPKEGSFVSVLVKSNTDCKAAEIAVYWRKRRGASARLAGVSRTDWIPELTAREIRELETI